MVDPYFFPVCNIPCGFIAATIELPRLLDRVGVGERIEFEFIHADDSVVVDDSSANSYFSRQRMFAPGPHLAIGQARVHR